MKIFIAGARSITNLVNQNKKVLVYITLFHKMFVIGTIAQLNSLLAHCMQETQKTYKRLMSNANVLKDGQLSFI